MDTVGSIAVTVRKTGATLQEAVKTMLNAIPTAGVSSLVTTDPPTTARILARPNKEE